MKIKWLVADVTAVESPDRAESAILGVICDFGRAFHFFCQFSLYLWPGNYFVMQEPPLEPS